MRKITYLSAIFLAAMTISCNRHDSPTEKPQDSEVAYLSLSVSAPATRAASSEAEDGTEEQNPTADENKVFSLALVAFDYNYDYISAYPVYADANKKFNCEVAPDARRFFAVVNPTKEIWAAINKISSFDQAAFSELPAIELTAASVSNKNFRDNGDKTELRGFTMVNEGAKNPESLLLECLVSVSTELSKDKTKPTEVEIAVDRLAAKFEFSVNSTFDANTKSALGRVEGVALTATNKATNLYSMINTDNLTHGNVYRTDHNMTVGQGLHEASAIRTELEKNFNWLKNEDEITDAAFIVPNATAGSVATTPEYVLENTCEPAYSNSNNLTQAIVKATYNPILTNGTQPTLGTSWFKILTTVGTLRLTFDEVVEIYNDKYAGFTATTAIKASMDIQLQNIMGDNTITWAKAGLTVEDLENAGDYGGYKAATVPTKEDYVVQFFQYGVNYYDIFIQHDDAQPIGHVGRWGMVRNNSYRMDISGISKDGLPYIPDPTDPEIVDPDNKKPEDPEPADKLNSFISVSITVNPWIIWFQESTLE